MAARPLKGAGIVITRPVHQGEALKTRLEGKGAQVLHFPSIEIAAVPRSAELTGCLKRLDQYHYAIFISPNAVEYAAELIDLAALPDKLKVAAIGPGTARALASHGRKPDMLPRDGASSEALLKLKALHAVDRKRVLIFRGQGGRELLAETLEERGAEVDYAEVYRRSVPRSGLGELSRWFREGRVDAIAVTSREALLNLDSMLSPALTPYLRAAQFLVSSPRLIKLASALGVRRRPLVASDAGDAALLDALVTWWSSRGHEPHRNRREHERSE
ncbi:MAG TPA: uroporphyrinogen-III synthase [Gammaproteobacteria bacterium]|jgi:uroporphyrinogen-III synthase|nr:uroporphyrinogen-III synthase [Gammaproteobacteria bacterium]